VTQINDLTGVETEHLVGGTTGEFLPLVTLRCLGNTTILLGQMSPADAREVAAHLFEAAARAEYETDLLIELKNNHFADEAIAGLFKMVRTGEQTRHKGVEGG
jgi:hypothetical protein